MFISVPYQTIPYQVVLPRSEPAFPYHVVLPRSEPDLSISCCTTTFRTSLFYHFVLPRSEPDFSYHVVLPSSTPAFLYHVVLPRSEPAFPPHVVLPRSEPAVPYHVVHTNTFGTSLSLSSCTAACDVAKTMATTTLRVNSRWLTEK